MMSSSAISEWATSGKPFYQSWNIYLNGCFKNRISPSVSWKQLQMFFSLNQNRQMFRSSQMWCVMMRGPRSRPSVLKCLLEFVVWKLKSWVKRQKMITQRSNWSQTAVNRPPKVIKLQRHTKDQKRHKTTERGPNLSAWKAMKMYHCSPVEQGWWWVGLYICLYRNPFFHVCMYIYPAIYLFHRTICHFQSSSSVFALLMLISVFASGVVCDITLCFSSPSVWMIGLMFICSLFSFWASMDGYIFSYSLCIFWTSVCNCSSSVWAMNIVHEVYRYNFIPVSL